MGKRIFKKYEFESESLANTRIDALPSDDDGNPTHKHSIVHLGYLWIKPPVYGEDGTIITEGVRSAMYSVDVLWVEQDLLDENEEIDYPYGWKSKEVQYDEDWINPNGAHTFLGWNF